MTHICITAKEESPKSLEARIAHVLKAHPRLLCELRLDYLGLDPAACFAFLAKLAPEWAPRLILTQRLRASGPLANGQCDWDVQSWQSWWKNVMALRTWFAVDLDWLILDRLAGESLDWRGKFRSRHAFFSLHASIDELSNLLPEMQARAKFHNAGIKLAAPVRGVRDLARLATMQASLGDHPLKTVVAMGDAGKAWRWSPLAGDLSYFAFAESSGTAPGQDLFENVLPYLAQKQIPDLYVLWSANPKNSHGEKEWNRIFKNRAWNARYVNVACSDMPQRDASTEEKKIWARSALQWMEQAGVKGASITKPMKELFPLVLPACEEPAINTLRYKNEWLSTNTDGPAVQELLQRHNAKSALVLGGGGAGQAVYSTLVKAGFEVQLVRRVEGRLPSLPQKEALISCWPADFQAELVDQLNAQKTLKPQLVLDAQFHLSEQNAPLKIWAKERGATYLHGSHWWRGQANRQDQFWFSGLRRKAIREKIWPALPSSKSETLRALAIAAFRPGKTKILHPALCEDSEFLLHALEELGLDCERGEGVWLVRSGPLRSKAEPIFLGDGAAVLRFMGALSIAIEGEYLLLDAAPGLRKRPMADLFHALSLPVQKDWPLRLPCGAALPAEVSVAKSSQYASGFMLAAAGLLWQKKRKQLEFKLLGELRSAPYLALTIEMLSAAGIQVESKEGYCSLSLGQQSFPAVWEFEVAKDASAVSYFELLSVYLGIGTLVPSGVANAQADWCFSEMLSGFLLQEELSISLRDAPDLAPTLFAAAVLFRRKLTIKDAPHLHDKECDRAKALVRAASTLGLPAQDFPDGFMVDARNFLPPAAKLTLRTKDDHRLAMAFAILSYVYPEIQIDNAACVAKSFPQFWESLQLFRGLLA